MKNLMQDIKNVIHLSVPLIIFSVSFSGFAIYAMVNVIESLANMSRWW